MCWRLAPEVECSGAVSQAEEDRQWREALLRSEEEARQIEAPVVAALPAEVLQGAATTTDILGAPGTTHLSSHRRQRAL